mgnify:CR=1 FL=1
MKAHSKLLFLFTLLFLSSILMLVSNRRADISSYIKERTYVIIGILQMGGFNLRTGLTEFIENIKQAEQLRRENKLLKNEIAQMRFKEKNYYEEIISSYQRLEKMFEDCLK